MTECSALLILVCLFLWSGYCHEQCTVSSTVLVDDEVEFLITCKQCYHTKARPQTENRNDSPTGPLLLGGQEFRNAVTVTKGRQVGNSRLVASDGTLELSSEMKSTNDSSSTRRSRNKLRSWGLIWKKKNGDATATDFISTNILLKGDPDVEWSRPVCHLCKQPYNSDLMYIRCGTCNSKPVDMISATSVLSVTCQFVFNIINALGLLAFADWYHAEAVELEESKIFDVVGFKCCRCRRIKSPGCPYLPLDSEKSLEGKKPRTRVPKQGVSEVDVDSAVISEQFKQKELNSTELAMTEEVTYVPDDDPLLSLPIVEHNSEVDISADTLGSGPQKLPIRRHVKRKKDLDSSLDNNESQAEISTKRNLLNPAEEALSPRVKWDVSTDGFEDNMMFDYDCLDHEDREFEPQTYFSYTELLASDDGGQSNGVDPSGDVTVDWKNISTVSRDGMLIDIYGRQEPKISLLSAVDMVPCIVRHGMSSHPGRVDGDVVAAGTGSELFSVRSELDLFFDDGRGFRVQIVHH
ncbi:unnamed protein product [Ilex paraguariensis]|uniref:Uncharacterized protein n=1 Tax=Ilex paraguariensis TaxID=185542 RepID=A0ABC8QWQ0_9AQUA